MSEHAAHLNIGLEPLFEKLSDIAHQNGFAIERSEEVFCIDAPLGRVELSAERSGTKVSFSARTAPELQLLKDLYAGRFAKLGFDTGIRWTLPDSFMPLNQTLCEVIDSKRISPGFQRVRLSGDFAAFAKPGVGLHFRLLFGPEAATWPSLDENGLTYWPCGVKSWHRPPYTVRRLSPAHDWMDVDIVLHDGGRVTEWCRQVARGTEIAIHGPSGSKHPTAGHLALFGDETALPVILRVIEDAPKGTTGRACIALRDLRDVQPIETAADIEVEWSSDRGRSAMQACLEELDFPAGDRHYFFAGERAAAAMMRDVFLAKGLTTSEFKSANYWTRTP